MGPCNYFASLLDCFENLNFLSVEMADNDASYGLFDGDSGAGDDDERTLRRLRRAAVSNDALGDDGGDVPSGEDGAAAGEETLGEGDGEDASGGEVTSGDVGFGVDLSEAQLLALLRLHNPAYGIVVASSMDMVSASGSGAFSPSRFTTSSTPAPSMELPAAAPPPPMSSSTVSPDASVPAAPMFPITLQDRLSLYRNLPAVSCDTSKHAVDLNEALKSRDYLSVLLQLLGHSSLLVSGAQRFLTALSQLFLADTGCFASSPHADHCAGLIIHNLAVLERGGAAGVDSDCLQLLPQELLDHPRVSLLIRDLNHHDSVVCAALLATSSSATDVAVVRLVEDAAAKTSTCWAVHGHRISLREGVYAMEQQLIASCCTRSSASLVRRLAAFDTIRIDFKKLTLLRELLQALVVTYNSLMSEMKQLPSGSSLRAPPPIGAHLFSLIESGTKAGQYWTECGEAIRAWVVAKKNVWPTVLTNDDKLCAEVMAQAAVWDAQFAASGGSDVLSLPVGALHANVATSPSGVIVPAKKKDFLCFRCLGKNHYRDACTATPLCFECGSTDHDGMQCTTPNPAAVPSVWKEFRGYKGTRQRFQGSRSAAAASEAKN